MNLGIITYQSRHLKTEQVALGLDQIERYSITFFALPFVQRPPRKLVFAHRPDMEDGVHTRELARALGCAYHPVGTADQIPPDAADYFIIAGAGLLPDSFTNSTAGRVINSHPGLIPAVRGLDAFKWAILDRQPVGNTLHLIDEEVDAGRILLSSRTPVFRDDNLESFARRHYDMEIAMLIGFERFLSGAPRSGDTGLEERPSRMRMKADDQERLVPAFDEYKRAFAFSDSNG